MWLALSKLRRGKIDECIEACDALLYQNPADQVYMSHVRIYFVCQMTFVRRHGL